MRLWLPRQAASVNSAKWRPLKPSEQFHLCRFAGKRGKRGEKKRFQVVGLLNHGKAVSQYFNEAVDPFNRQPLCLMVGPEQFLTRQHVLYVGNAPQSIQLGGTIHEPSSHQLLRVL